MHSVFYIGLTLFAADVSGLIINGPLNAIAEVGQQAIFNCTCTSDLTLQNWILSTKREDLGTVAAQNIAVYCAVQPGFTTHYEVDRPGGNINTCNLIVKNTTMQQSGIYTCTDVAYGPSAILTVIDSSPVITVNDTNYVIENENLLFECVTNYNGTMPPAPSLRPYFYWTHFNGQNVSSSYDSTTENTVVSRLTVTAGREDIMPFTCHVYLQLIPPSNSGYASNTPTVSSNASSPIYEVIYAPSIPNITSKHETLTKNGVACVITALTCSSTCIPAPNYRWYDSEENVTLSTSSTLAMTQENRNYTCQAYNTIRNVMHTATRTYTVSKVHGTSTVERCAQDLIERRESTSQPEIPIHSGPPIPSAYEELRRADEKRLQPTA